MAQAEPAFLDANPAFRETGVLDELRAPSTGGSTRAATSTSTTPAAACTRQSQLDEHLRLLRESVYGNPHSVNPTSSAATVLVEQARAAVLRYFNAPESEYACIFTPNATGALRLVGEAYPFGAATTASWRRSTTTTRSTGSASSPARRARGRRTCRSRRPTCASPTGCSSATSTSAGRGGHNLFAYPGAVELLRRQAPARVDRAGPGARLGRDRRRARRSCRRAGSTCRSGSRTSSRSPSTRCSATRPASARCSRGARRSSGCSAPGSAAARSSPRTSRARWSCRCPGHALFEDGTVNYLGIPAIEIGLRHLERIGIDTISRRVEALGTWLLEALQRAAALGRQPGDARLRADDLGSPRRHDLVQLPAPGRPRGRRALRRRRRGRAPHLASGRAASATPARARPRSRSRSDTLIGAEFADGMILDDYIRLVGMPTGGAVRVSLGLATNFADVHRFMTLRDGVPRRHRGAGGPAAPARLLDAQPPAGRAGAAPAAARPSGRGGSRRGTRASRPSRRGTAARTASCGSTSRSVRSRVAAVTGDGPPSIRLS